MQVIIPTEQSDVTMSNPHTYEIELAYLAGVIDGEGCISLERNGNRRLNGVTGLQAMVCVTNTNEALISYCLNIFRRIGVNPYIKSQAVGYGKKARCKTCYWLTTQGLTKTKKVLEAVLPYLIAKRAQAELVLEFIKLRGDSQLAKGKPYGDAEYGILTRIRALNFRGVSETEDHMLGQVAA